MKLFTDDHPETTLHGLQFQNKELALKSIQLIEAHFTKLMREQKINAPTPNNVRPHKVLTTKKDIEKYYETQKMWRVLALLNRAKVLYKKTKKKDLLESIKIFEEWMEQYS